MTGEEVGCCFRGAGLGGLRKELAVLCVKDSVEGGEIAGGDGVEERIVVCGHSVVRRGKLSASDQCL